MIKSLIAIIIIISKLHCIRINHAAPIIIESPNIFGCTEFSNSIYDLLRYAITDLAPLPGKI